MKFTIPDIFPDSNTMCSVRGLDLNIGDRINANDVVAEIRYEVIDDISDCPIVTYGELVSLGTGIIRWISEDKSLKAGSVLLEIGDEVGEFPNKLVTW
ncbi:hypothetical protein WH50_12570 [Pokkaliibacter plantistimulans]|uniref:Lipoyl-binding domain-containing protein n=1 Tax=Pokkaliibacter plantistimulans TaxID=1635171 RepID=A0ABX5LWB1_9GAMM|nr:hypothetical protein [Pokkaliibacter plantistimulans]PXF30949.1 hypothetical protein WH50_12570 [Pokkaliibacter plantistimulans]